uniref:Uncharacterized protein n=1 Tax=viral metagenome TaxID=1070528 RepID=A0A6C0M0C6_9ZZZZ
MSKSAIWELGLVISLHSIGLNVFKLNCNQLFLKRNQIKDMDIMMSEL